MYLASIAVLMSECLKLLACLAVEFGVYRRFNKALCMQSLRAMFMQWDALKLAVPAILYTVQNNLQYLAVSKLDAATFQVTYQLKIITTAVFSVILLNRKLTRLKWVALILLTFGIALVQLPVSNGPSSSSGDLERSGNDFIVGLIAVLCSCCLSGLAGVYFEKILKKPASSALPIHMGSAAAVPAYNASLWERNIQLAAFSILLALAGAYSQDGNAIRDQGAFAGFSGLVWTVICTQALGGLIVAVVVKYADNILKGFATSLSIILSSVLSVWIFDFVPSPTFLLGALIVIYATYIYDSPQSQELYAKSTSTENIPLSINSRYSRVMHDNDVDDDGGNRRLQGRV